MNDALCCGHFRSWPPSLHTTHSIDSPRARRFQVRHRRSVEISRPKSPRHESCSSPSTAAVLRWRPAIATAPQAPVLKTTIYATWLSDFSVISDALKDNAIADRCGKIEVRGRLGQDCPGVIRWIAWTIDQSVINGKIFFEWPSANVLMALCWTTERVLQRVAISLQRFTATCRVPSLVRIYRANPTPKSWLNLANNPSQPDCQAFGQHVPHSSLIRGPLTSPSYSVLRHIRRCIHSSISECLILGDWRVDEQKVVL